MPELPKAVSKEEQDALIWSYMIDRYGRQEFKAVYEIIKRFGFARLTQEGNAAIQEQASIELTRMGMTDAMKQQDLIGVVASFVQIEEYKKA